MEMNWYLSGRFSKYWGQVPGKFNLLRLRLQTFGGYHLRMVQILSRGGHPHGWLRLGGKYLAYGEANLEKENRWGSLRYARRILEEISEMESWSNRHQS